MALFWNELDTTSYNNSLFDFIKTVEEAGSVSLTAYDDGVGNPTIGIGFNLNTASIRDVVIQKLFYPDATPTAAAQNEASPLILNLGAANDNCCTTCARKRLGKTYVVFNF